MLKKVLIGVAAVLAVLLIVIGMQPPTYSVTRSATIQAAPSRVFGIVSNLRRWNDWSPWAKMDPDSKTVYEGPASGPGAVMAWEGKKTGSGKMTLTSSRASESLQFHLEMIRPMRDEGEIEFTFKPEGKGTAVTWTMSGKMTFLSKAMCLVKGMDGMLGPMFEQGLASLKALAEAR